MAAAFATVALLCAIAVSRLPGRTTQHARVSSDVVLVPPGVDEFTVSPLRWDLRAYATSAKLEPLRRFFADGCAGTRGVEAATCLSNRFARAFRHGVPRREFFAAEYDPVADLEEHMHGAPGHCVTRSGLIAAILLSVSIPARQVQLLASRTVGHNALEVWDEHSGWALFDPTWGNVFVGPSGPLSAAKVMLLREPGQWVSRGIAPGHAPGDEPIASDALRGADQNAQSSIRYPDPWLYTRAGKRAASWPFRGLVVNVGAVYWDGGPAQDLLRALGCLFALIAAAIAGRLVLIRWLSRTSSRRA
jgi:hypothetical protein